MRLPIRQARLAALAGKTVLHRLIPRLCSVNSIIGSIDRLGGVPQKIGQLLATARVSSSNQAYAQLCEGTGKLEYGSFIRGAKSAWKGGPDAFDKHVLTVDSHSVGASLGQVQSAILKDGRRVAIKLKYPDIEYSSDADLSAIGMLLNPLDTKRQGDLGRTYRNVLSEAISSELDYLNEAREMLWFRERLGDDPVLKIPDVIVEHSSRDLLVTEWAAGGSIQGALDWQLGARQIASQALVTLTLQGLVSWGKIHGDLNPGNLRFALAEDGAPILTLLDFGAVHVLTQSEVGAWKMLIETGITRRISEAEALIFFSTLGFDKEQLCLMAGSLPAVCDCLLRPFRSRDFNTRTWSLAGDLARTLGPNRLSFRKAAPPRFLLFIRAVHGLLTHLDALNAKTDWVLAFNKATGRSDLASLRPSHEAAALAAQSPLPPPSLPDLHLCVIRDGVKTVDITLPNASLDELEHLVPESFPHDAEMVRRVANDARTKRNTEEMLLNLTHGNVQVRIWLGRDGALEAFASPAKPSLHTQVN